LAQFKLNSLTPYCQARPLLGSHLYWNINHLCSMTLKHFLKSSMSPLEIQTKNSCLALKYDFFVKITFNYGICIGIQTIGLWCFMGWSNAHKLVPIWVMKWCKGLATPLLDLSILR
jgi:hypothetical protein